MNKRNSKVVKAGPVISGAAALFAILVVAGPATGASSPATPPSAIAAPMLLADATPAGARKASRKGAESPDASADARIKFLHEKLGITSAQEAEWGKVAAVMHDNAEKITVLAKERAEKSKTMTAVEDLQSYAEISGAHEDGTKNLIPVFKTLYDDMSDAQKKTADALFRGHGHHEHDAHGAASS